MKHNIKMALILGLTLIVVLFSAACSSSSPAKGVNQSTGSSGPGVTYTMAATTKAAPTRTASGLSATPMPMPTKVTSASADSSYSNGGNEAIDYNAPAAVDRMVVRTGYVQMVVNQITVSLESVTNIASRYGGYVINSQQWKEGDRNIGSISIRVLAENYNQALVEVRALAKSVTTESTNTQDVTEEYTDLESRTRNLTATETQLLKIMEGATKTEDILSIQRELTNVRGEIEQIKGRMLYLERTTSTSLINIQMEEAVLAVKFNAANVSAGTNESIAFSSEVIGGFAPYNYFWDFGDGNTSVEQSPRHAYKTAGSYTVYFKVVDDKGYTNSLVRASYINIVNTWKPGSVAGNAWNGLTVFARGLVNFLIWVGIFSFVWVPIGVIVWYFAFYRRRKKHI